MAENLTHAKPTTLLRRMRVRPAAALAVAGALASVVVIAGCGDSANKSNTLANTTVTKTNAVTATPDGLRALGVKMEQPIFWVGARTDVSYERTRTSTGRIIVRYLPVGARVGTPKLYLTVGTYKLANAYAATQFAAKKSGAIRLEAPGDAIAFSTKARPLNAWVTYPGSRYQIEVFSPKPGVARSLVSAGHVARVPGTPRETTRPVAVTPARLATLASAEQPIYWAGPKKELTYELRKTSQGGFLVRYLPSGTTIGASEPRLTIGTYPVKSAFAAVKRLSTSKGATAIKLPGGGLAVVSPRFPKSVYFAYPGTNVEVEVFDPSLAQARKLVTTGQIIGVT